MSEEHTKGPWNNAGEGWIEGPNGEYVLEYAGCGSHAARWGSVADMRLAIASPDLLECVQEIEAYWASGNFTRDAAMWERLRAAITKATGKE